MKSLYYSVALAMVGTLALALLVFTAISNRLEKTYIDPVFEAMDQLELESAQDACDRNGPAAVTRYMDHLNNLFGPSHYLLNANGVEVVSGKSFADDLPQPPARMSRGFLNGRFVVTRRSDDGRYWFLTVNPQMPNRWEFSPYYLLVIGVSAAFCWLAAVFVVMPIRNITTALVRFGKGDLAARTRVQRRDEIGILSTSFNDMAERIERLLLSEKRLLEDISHELRSPLARMKLAVKLARNPSEPNTALDRVEREVNRIEALTSEIVEVTRLEGDPRLLKLGSVSLFELAQEAVHDCCAEVEPRLCNVRIDARFRGDLRCDRELLRRAVENLLRNAIRYSPEDAPIDIVLDQGARNVIITVRDYGVGVPEASVHQIFEPFFRVDKARDRNSGGVGLGLSIVRRVVLLHNGKVSARNAHPGLSIAIELPR